MPKIVITLDHIRQARETVIAHPETYDQKSWCGTACCLWGHAYIAATGSQKGAEGGPNSAWVNQSTRCQLAAIGLKQINSNLAMLLTGMAIGIVPENYDGSLDLSGLTSAKDLTLPSSVGGGLDLSGLKEKFVLPSYVKLGGSLYL